MKSSAERTLTIRGQRQRFSTVRHGSAIDVSSLSWRRWSTAFTAWLVQAGSLRTLVSTQSLPSGGPLRHVCALAGLAIPCRAIRAIAFVVDGLRAATALNVLSSTDVRQVQWMKTADEEDCPDKRQGPFHSEKQRITLEAE